MPRTVVSFHAHPDDEAMLTAGSLAGAADDGHRVVLAFATRGEVGDVDGAILGSEDLGARRTSEAEAAAAAIGAARVVFLDYRDSGSGPSPAPGSFATAEVDEAARRLAALLEEEHADVVTTYDPNGGYGHPDHRQVHVVGQRAAALAGTPVVLEATLDRALLRTALELGPAIGLALPEGFEVPDVSSWYASIDEITHRVDVTGHLDAKRAAMAAHASQTTSATSPVRSLGLFLALPDEWFAVAFGTEWFIDRARAGGPPADDLFAGIDLTPTS
jgi:LmbE family N-acetylglucosaminyl deacetylase